MSVLNMLSCDVCGKTSPGVTLPDDWYALAHNGEHWHFHDEACLAIWRLTMLSMPPQQPQQEQPACKARRFLLFDENADSTEGVQWGDGRVQLETHKWEGENVARSLFGDWEEFKAHFPGSGVQWIDQEVAE